MSHLAGKPMTFVEAARAVLADAEGPLHYREITRRALDRNLLVSSGKTPEETLNARLCVDLKQHGDASEFIRTAPGLFALRVKSAPHDSAVAGDEHRTDDAQVRVPFFPNYDEVRAVLPVWAGLKPERVTRLHRAIMSLTGNPKEPDDWIPKRLEGENRELALHMWQRSKRSVNPRYMAGHWLLARTYELLDARDGKLDWTERGRDFVANPSGDTVRWIDDREGLLQLLSLLADRGQAQTSEIWEPWRSFLDEVSNVRSDSYARAMLYDRIRNLLARGLAARSGRVMSATPDGLDWLRAGGQEPSQGTPSEHFDIQSLAQQQRAHVRTALIETLREMNPIAFEHTVAALLNAMGYDNVQVTAPSNDKGVDVVANIKLGISSVREVIQVKRQKSNIGRPVLDALRGSLHRFHGVRGTIITTGGFTQGTVKAAFEPGAAPITLIDGEALVDLLMEHNIGVRRRPIVLFELDPAGLGTITGSAQDNEGID